MKFSTPQVFRFAMGGLAGLAIAFSASMTLAQDEEGRRRGRPDFRGGDRPAPEDGQRGGPREGRGGFRGGPGGGPGGPGGGPGMLMRLPVMAALDADGDGEISAKEIEGAVAALKKLDKNNDGKLTFAEMVPERGGPGGPGGRPGFGGGRPPMDGEGRGPGERGQGERGQGGRGPGDRGGRGGGFGGNLSAAIDRMMEQDKDGDGLLSKDEIPERMAAMLDRADSDDDGKLSKKELETAFQARMENMRRGGARPQGGRPGGGRETDTPGGERPRRPPVEK